MPGHSRLKDGVASLAYGAGHPRLGKKKSWMAGTSPAMTWQNACINKKPIEEALGKAIEPFN
jgi:hypothetical protein